MLVATYNIQWGKGRDGRVDLDRIARTVRDADIIGLQEVECNWRQMAHADQPARLSELLPDRYCLFGPSVDIDASQRRPDGTVANHRRQYGLLVLSRWPILSVRSFPLPKYPVHGHVNDTSILLETVVGHPRRPIRFYNTHLNYLSERQRQIQVRELIGIVADAPAQGGSFVGPGVPEDHFGADWIMLLKHELPPMPQPAILLGDFNMTSDSLEYGLLTGPVGPDYGRVAEYGLFADALTLSGMPEGKGITYPANDDEAAKRIDHILVTADLAGDVKRGWIDESADGSDHQPVWAEIELGDS
ncbi:MAG: endonuclease/exonuclease/phosphatase family protein [Dongiaceae bacterium]